MNNNQILERPSFFLIDGNSYIYRAFYAIRGLSNSKGFPTNAVYGFTNMLQKVIREKKPDYLAMVFDTKGPTTRHKEFAEYKANRKPMPDPLVVQIPYIHRLVEAFNIRMLMIEGYEADDIIGTIAKRGAEQGLQVTIVSGDKDMFQLVSPNIKIYDTMKDKVYEEKDVFEKFGVSPDGVVEIMGLMGDASDNIPGVKGIGEKTAYSLIAEFGTIENLILNIDKIKKKNVQELLKKNIEDARISKGLATIMTDLNIEFMKDEFKINSPHKDQLIDIFKELEFSKFIESISEVK